MRWIGELVILDLRIGMLKEGFAHTRLERRRALFAVSRGKAAGIEKVRGSGSHPK